MTSHSETPLQGGRTTAGVVKVGDTVRRPSTANSSFVHQLLHHLEVSGFDEAPLALGNDESGRDIFSYVEGDVPSDLAYFDDNVLMQAARLIRRYHDVTQSFILTLDASTDDIEVVCHNDLSPCNFVFRDRMPYAIIDFDAAQPGTRLHDLGYAAWLWLDIGSDEISAAEQIRRIGLFSAAYGCSMSDNSALFENMILRQEIISTRGLEVGNPAMKEWADRCRAWTRRHIAGLQPR